MTGDSAVAQAAAADLNPVHSYLTHHTLAVAKQDNDDEDVQSQLCALL